MFILSLIFKRFDARLFFLTLRTRLRIRFIFLFYTLDIRSRLDKFKNKNKSRIFSFAVLPNGETKGPGGGVGK